MTDACFSWLPSVLPCHGDSSLGKWAARRSLVIALQLNSIDALSIALNRAYESGLKTSETSKARSALAKAEVRRSLRIAFKSKDVALLRRAVQASWDVGLEQQQIEPAQQLLQKLIARDALRAARGSRSIERLKVAIQQAEVAGVFPGEIIASKAVLRFLSMQQENCLSGLWAASKTKECEVHNAYKFTAPSSGYLLTMAAPGVKILKHPDSKAVPDDLVLPKARYGFGVSWEETPGRDVDIDLQCVAVNNAGTITDCAYYNNMKACGAITHSGDEASGRQSGIAEMVWVNMRRLPDNVSLLIFVVAAYAGGSLQDAANGKLHVLEERESNEVALFEMERSTASVDIVAAMYRSPSGWNLRILDVPGQTGQHFMDILPLLCQVIREFLPHAPKTQKVAFAMEKGGVLDLPQNLGKIVVGLGWDVDSGKCDLDVSAVLCDSSGRDIRVVFFGRLVDDEHGITHTGDNLTGEGEGDDEQIIVELSRVGAVVQQIFFVVNIYTKGKTFRQVANPFCRVIDEASQSELCRYSLRESAGNTNGLLIARLVREAGGRWGFHALGLPCHGSMYKDSLPKIRETFGLKTATLAVRRGASSDEIEGPPRLVPVASKQECGCVVQ